MMRAGLCAVAFAIAFTRGAAADPKAVDLSALRDAVETAAKKGENVDDVRKALEALEKAAPSPAAGRVPRELQALRDAVTAAAKKGENVEGIAKELAKVETAVTGRELVPPKPEAVPPRPEPRPRPIAPQFPPLMNPGIERFGGGLDVETFNKAMALQRKAIELMLKDPNDPNAIKEAEKLRAEASELMLKAALGLGGGGFGANGIAGIAGIGAMPFPDPAVGRVPDRARLGIRPERVSALAAEQLGLAPNTGIAVTLVAPNSAAEKAGLKVHDIILEFGGKAVTDDTDEFIRRVNAVKAGEKIDMTLLRKGKKVDVKGVELAGGPQAVAPIPNAVRPLPMLKAADALELVKPLPPLVVPNPLPLQP